MNWSVWVACSSFANILNLKHVLVVKERCSVLDVLGSVVDKLCLLY